MARHFITSLAYLLVVKHCSGYATRLLTRDKCSKFKENLFSFVSLVWPGHRRLHCDTNTNINRETDIRGVSAGYKYQWEYRLLLVLAPFSTSVRHLFFIKSISMMFQNLPYYAPSIGHTTSCLSRDYQQRSEGGWGHPSANQRPVLWPIRSELKSVKESRCVWTIRLWYFVLIILIMPLQRSQRSS